ncbi:FAD binding domain-containing protein [Phlyctema vagabunda]|uniref:FAD binding domain-containing protein n=1 Tax=Phlyctema vagabunda TaxID=108571 RepID=A0ABR4PKD4_9HELO
MLIAQALKMSPVGSLLFITAAAAAAVSAGYLETLLTEPGEFGFDEQWDSGIRYQLERLKTSLASSSDDGCDNCQNACSLLSILVPNNVSSSSSPDYVPIPYWSIQQSEVTPACRIDVSSAEDIATTIKVANLTECPFAVKSGGHAAFPGGSSIENGILINLANLNTVSLSADRTTASLGPGNKWYDVYKTLDPLGVSVIGGREAGVGVGGLTLGGGISYFSGRFGWACDNVLNYEVVLANASIVNASPTSHADLYQALRGGGGTNFGIVSRFDVAAFEQGLLWGGSRYYSMDQNHSLADAYSQFLIDAPSDDFAHLYLAFAYAAQLGGFIAITGPTYGRPVADPPIFEQLNKIPNLVDLTSVSNMTSLAVALNQTAYLREIFKTVTFRDDASLIKEIISIFVEEAGSLLSVPGFAPAFAFQPLSLNILQHMSKNGGNVLGLADSTEPLTIMNLNWGWSSAADDQLIFTTVDRFLARSVALADDRDANNKYIYMNYAAPEQAVFEGYGEENLIRLTDIKSKYDPGSVFGRLQAGYFKLH